ncbi:MAG: AMP-binding protein [Pseudomonadales bacterium]|nr:AMP-binding protein [Pseudomonadales bacterium]
MLNTGERLDQVILKACRQYRDKIAYTCMDAHLSYRQLEGYSAHFCAYLQQHTDLRPGERIAIQLPNLLQYPVVLLGALRAGLVVVNTNPVYSPRELEHQLADSGARALVVLANTAASAAQILSRTPVKYVIVTELADLHPPLKRLLINFVARYVKKLVPAFRFSESISFRKSLALGRSALKKHPDMLEQPVALSASDPVAELAVLQYTGGTTGVAKGAMLTHANLVANLYQVKSHLAEECPGPGEVMVAPLPLYHIYAFTMNIAYTLHQGIHNILIPDPRDIPAFVKAIKPYRIAGFVGLNTLYNALSMNSEFSRLDFSALKISSSGGMALSTKTYRRWLDLTGCRIIEGYGLTETSPLVACNSEAAFQEGSIGRPVPQTQVKVVDEAGHELPAGEAGELCVKGPQVMAGYWQNHQETEKVLDADGWLRTGDVAVIQPDGFIRIVDRIKDVIIVAGFNVFPNEIEDHVCRHPDVREAAAIGVQRGENGQKVKLFVVAASPGLSKAAILEHCRQGLAPYKIPRLIEFCDTLPKSNVGKVLRRALRDPEKHG